MQGWRMHEDASSKNHDRWDYGSSLSNEGVHLRLPCMKLCVENCDLKAGRVKVREYETTRCGGKIRTNR